MAENPRITGISFRRNRPNLSETRQNSKTWSLHLLSEKINQGLRWTTHQDAKKKEEKEDWSDQVLLFCRVSLRFDRFLRKDIPVILRFSAICIENNLKVNFHNGWKFYISGETNLISSLAGATDCDLSNIQIIIIFSPKSPYFLTNQIACFSLLCINKIFKYGVNMG